MLNNIVLKRIGGESHDQLNRGPGRKNYYDKNNRNTDKNYQK